MKIAMVCPYNYFKPGGVQTHIRELSENLRNRGCQVKVIAPFTPTYPSHNHPEDPNLICVGSNRRIKFQGTQIDFNIALGKEYQTLKKILTLENFDLIHFHTIWNPFIPFQVLWMAQSISVATFHDTPSHSWFGKLASSILMPAAGYILAKYFLDAVIAVSAVPARILKKFYNGKINIIANGIETGRFSPEKNRPFSTYRDGKINILFLGRLEHRKGVIYLLQAYANLKKRYAHLRLLIAGEGYLRREITEFVVRNNLADVEMLGYIEEKDKPRWYATCDIYCSPASYGESFGIVLVEAMASGKPAVGSANAGYRTILAEQGHQLLVEPESAHNLEKKLAALIENENLRQELGVWGELEAQKYDWNQVTTLVEIVYREAFNHRLHSRL